MRRLQQRTRTFFPAAPHDVLGSPDVAPPSGFDAPAGQGDELARTSPSSKTKAIHVSSPPRSSERKPARAQKPAADDAQSTSSSGKQAPLSQRLPGMSDYQLTAYQSSAARIGRDPEHPKHASARKAIPMIEAEIRRRADALSTPRTEDAT